MDLSGRVALITGGAHGIGAATVHRLAEAGAEIVLHFQRSRSDAEAVRLSAPEPDRILLAQADLREATGPAWLIEQIRSRHGRLDYLVNNAAVTPPSGSGAEPWRFDSALWDEVLTVNLRAPVELALRAAELMHESRESGAAIVNIGSAGSERGEGSSTEMVAAKGAIPNLTRNLARRLAPAIRVNAVLPGLIDTEEIAARGENFSARKADMLRRTAMARMGTADEVAELILFLLTGTSFITGQAIAVDGGMML